MYGKAFHPYGSQSKDVLSGGENSSISKRWHSRALKSFEVSIRSPYPQVDFFQARSLGPCSFLSQESDQPSIGLCVPGVLRDNGIMNSKLSWCQSSVTQAWHLGVGCFHSEQLCKFQTTFQFEDPLTPA